MSASQAQPVGTYLYCVTQDQPFMGKTSGFQAEGIAGRPVRIVAEGGLAALVSDSPSEQYDITLENVSAHERVVETAMQRADVLPASFGTVATSDQEIRERLLKIESDELHGQLESIKGRVELGVKALWNQETLFSQIAAEDSAIRQLRDQIVGTTSEESYDLRIQLGELADAAIQRQREQDARAILDELSPLAVDTRINDIITDMMIVNASFLVEKAKVQPFQSKVTTLERAQNGRITIQFAGPLPPYSFVSVVVRWEEPSGAITH